jgi:hypothetical protein
MNWDTTTSWNGAATLLIMLGLAAAIGFCTREKGQWLKTTICFILVVSCIAFYFSFCIKLLYSRGSVLEEKDLLGYRFSPGTELKILGTTDDTGRGTFYHIVHVSTDKHPTSYELTARYEPGSYILVPNDNGMGRVLRKIAK